MFLKKTKSMILLIVCFMGTQAYASRNKLHDGGDLSRQTAYGSASWLQDLFVANSEDDPAAGNYRSIGGDSLSKPSCVSWGPERVDCFVRGELSRVYHWYKDNGAYYKWEAFEGTILGDIESVSKYEGYIDVVVTGTDTGMLVNTYEGSWSGFQSKGGQIVEEPSCIKRSSSIVDCIARGVDSKAYAVGAVDGDWGSFENIGGLFIDPPALSRRSDYIFDAWGVGDDSQLYHNWWNGKWNAWESIGSGYKGRPSVMSWNVDRIDVFLLGTDDHLWHLPWNGKWLPWEDLGGILQDVPSCVNIDEDIHCFGIGPRSHLYRKSYIGGTWTGWFNAYGAFIQAPSCVVSNQGDKVVSCYMRDFTRGIVELIYKF